MPSITGPEQALDFLNEALKKRDIELDSLRKQLSQLKHELSLTAAERDHLRVQNDSQEQRDLQLRRGSTNDPVLAAKPDFRLLSGQCLAKSVHDPRIGRPKRLLVIGGGPAGLISLHELLNPFNRPKDETLDGYQIELYERRAEVGGVWYFEPENDIAKGWHHGAAGLKAREEDHLEEPIYTNQSAGDMELMDMSWWSESAQEPKAKTNGVNGHADSRTPTTNGVHPQNGHTDSHTNGHTNGQTNEHARRRVSRSDSNDFSADLCYLNEPRTAPRWPSAAYEGLVGNVLPPLLEFSAHRFPKPKGGLFPSQIETHEYLLGLAGPLRPHIRTCQEVISIRPLYNGDSKAATWEVTKIDWTEQGHGAEIVEEWDGVMIAAGAFDCPYFPPGIPGLQKLLDERSNLVMHAKTYPGPRPFVNQHNKIVVVGNANSANDIAAHLAPLNSSGPIYRCIRHESNFAHLPDSRIKDVASIASIRKSHDRATLSITLHDGMQIDGVTKLIFASGYEYRFGWVDVPDIRDTLHRKLVPASFEGAVPYLHNATFVASAPTLSFIGLSAGSTPMPMAEIQARTVARAFYGMLELPETTDGLLENYNERAKELGLSDENPDAWRQLHMVRGPPERKLTQLLLDGLEDSEEGASQGLFRWDEWREGLAKTMRAAKEKELRRLRDAKVAAGGVDGGVGGILSYGLTMGQKFNPVFGSTSEGRGKSLML